MKPTSPFVVAAALAFATALSSCATTEGAIKRAQSEAASLAAYQESAGPEVQRFNKVGMSLYNWESFDLENLVLYATPSKAYLVKVSHCPGLDFAQAIRVSDSMGQIQKNFDKIYVLDGTPSAHIGCPIQTIRPVDLAKYKMLKAEFHKATPATS